MILKKVMARRSIRGKRNLKERDWGATRLHADSEDRF